MMILTTSYSLIQLKNSPIEFAKIILCACSGFKFREPNILDIYLILPTLLYEAGTKNLRNANATSSIHSIYLQDNIVGVAGLQNRLDKLKQKTIESFIIATNMNYIEIDYDTLNIKVTKHGEKHISNFKKNKKLCREAFNLGKVLSKNDIKENYRLLGVKCV